MEESIIHLRTEKELISMRDESESASGKSSPDSAIIQPVFSKRRKRPGLSLRTIAFSFSVQPKLL